VNEAAQPLQQGEDPTPNFCGLSALILLVLATLNREFSCQMEQFIQIGTFSVFIFIKKNGKN